MNSIRKMVKNTGLGLLSGGEQMNLGKKHPIVLLIIVILIAVVAWIAWSNTALTARELTVASESLPENFSGYKIAQVSDLHNAEFGNNNQQLLDLLSDSKADIIVITGDMIDSRRTNIDIALEFAKKATEVAPVYYVTGNHESRITEYERMETGLMECGVTVLRNEIVELQRNGQAIQLIGMDDPTFAEVDRFDHTEAMIADNTIKELIKNSEEYTILLSHRPELFDVYVSNELNLVFSGHAHGGQFRLPFIGGLAAPNQGLLPKYDSGLYTKENTDMIVSRGLGNSIIPFRINNRPEIVVVTLEVRE